MSERNRLYYGDNLAIMHELPDCSIDLIYLDPPFNSKGNYHVLHNDVHYKAQNEVFRDTWTWGVKSKKAYDRLMASRLSRQTDRTRAMLEGLYKALGGCGLLSYLLYMQERLVEMHRLLKDTGSLYLHCDPTASHYIKLVLDSIFHAKNFRNEIVWGYRTGGNSEKQLPRKHDVIFCYGRVATCSLHNPLVERVYYNKPFINTQKDEEGRYYADVYTRDVWEDIKPIINLSKERLGYPTQKPVKLLERIIACSTHKGDAVMDPYCGCGTTIDAAQALGRRWIGIDMSYLAIDLTEYRLVDKYKKQVKRTYEVLGTPKDFAGAQELFRSTITAAYNPSTAPKNIEESIALAESDFPKKRHGKNAGRFEFQRWVCSLIDAIPNDRKIGEGGMDGKLRWSTSEKGKYLFGAVEVASSRNITLQQVQAMKGVISNGSNYVCGILIALYKTSTASVQDICGSFDISTWRHHTQNDYPRLQVWSVEEHFAGKRPNLPTPDKTYNLAVVKAMKIKRNFR